MKSPIEPTLDDLQTVSTKLPNPVVSAVDLIARRELRTRADVLRIIIIDDLRRRGVVAPIQVLEPA